MKSEADSPGAHQTWLTGTALFALGACGVALLWWRFNPAPPHRGIQYPGDLINYFYPLKQLVATRLAAGDLPLWNPHACSGIPLLATLQVAVFYPGTWLSVWLTPERAIPTVLFVECIAAGWFAALLFRAWQLTPLASGLGGVLFVFSCVLGQTFWPAEVSAIVWMPWLLLCVEKLTQRWRWRWWLGVVAGTALSLLAGFPQLTLYTFYLLVPFAALRVVERSRQRNGGDRPGGGGEKSRARDASAARLALGLAAGVALGAGIAGIQLLPTLELVAQSQRGAPLSASQAEYLRFSSLSTLLGNSVDPRPKLIAFDFGAGMGYLGIATLLGLAAGLAAGFRRPLVWLLVGAAVASALLSDGPAGAAGGLYRLYESLPTGSTFRTPERLRLITFFCAIAVATIGIDAFDRGPTGARRRAVVGAAVLCAVTIAVFGPAAAAWRAGVALAALVALAVANRRPALRLAARAGLAALVLFDLASATGPHGSLRAFPAEWARTFHTHNHSVLADTEFSRLRARAGLDRLELVGETGSGLRVRPPVGVPPVDGAYRLSCYEPLVPRAWSALASATNTTSFTLENLDPERFAAVYDVASVAWLVRLRRSEPDRPIAELIAELSQDAGFYSKGGPPRAGLPPGVFAEWAPNSDALPRAYLIDDFRVMSDAEALAQLVAGDFDPRHRVLLDGDPGLIRRTTGRAARPVEITAYAPERVEISLRTPDDALLVLTDTHFPGWRATVDGDPVEIYRANALYRAIRVPAGARQVVFEYTPLSLRWGAALSLASVVASAALPIVALRRRR